MIVRRIRSEGIAHNSYFLCDDGEALVVDPRRDCDVYVSLAVEECAGIRYILETHRNEDYVTGSLELKELTSAEIVHSREGHINFGDHNVCDNETLNLGNLKLKIIYTPGHTDDSVCYCIYDLSQSKIPLMLFSGDTLFIGDVGRTDLLGIDVWRRQTEKLYDSIHDKLLPLGDHVSIYPSHGAGSICGHKISKRKTSTIGYERKSNPLLQLDKESFVDRITALKLLRPPYFRKMEHYNLNGPPLLAKTRMPQPLDSSFFKEESLLQSTVIVDTRNPDAFAASHIPTSLNIWLDGLGYFSGWVLKYDQRILLVMERTTDIAKARVYLRRLGLDNISGYLCPDIKEWRNQGGSTESIGTLSVKELRHKLAKDEISLLDVREEHEWTDGHVNGARRIYVGHIFEKADELAHDKPIATACEWGGRGGIAASILKKIGFKQVHNVLGGMQAWRSMGYSLVSGL